MSFLSSSAAVSSLVADGGYVYPVSVPPALGPASFSDTLAIVGGIRYGPKNVPIGPINVTSTSGFGPILQSVGDGVINFAHIPYDAVREATTATPEATSFLFVAPTDGTDTAATIVIPDATGFASQTFTGGGTWTTGKTLTMNVTPVAGSEVSVSYISGANGDTTIPEALQQLLNLFNLSSAVIGPNAFCQKATLAGDVITVTALASGTTQNTVGTTTNTPTGFTFVAGGATMAGGAAPGTMATLTFQETGTLANGATAILALTGGSLAAGPVFSFSLAMPYNGQQTWFGILGSSGPTVAYSASTFIANLVAAINGTVSTQIASAFVTAAAGSSTADPLTATTFTASGGTDGTAGLTTSLLIGTDGVTGRTGMYALRGKSFGALILAECTDPTADAAIQAFLSEVGGIGITGFPAGKTTTSAVADKTTYNLNNQRIMRVIDWVYAPDTLAQQSVATVSPLGAVAGIVMSLEPQEDPSNKPQGATKGNIFGTQRTVGPNNAYGLPYTGPVDPASEGATRKQNGFQYITNGQPRTNGLLGLAHGKMSDGATDCADIRMFDYIASAVLAILQQYVGFKQTPPAAQGTFDTDPTRKLIRNNLQALKNQLLNANDPQLAAFGYQFTGTAQQVATGYCPWSIQGQTLSGIQFAIAGLAIGQTVAVAADA